VHFAPLEHPLNNVAVDSRAHFKDLADLGGEILKFMAQENEAAVNRDARDSLGSVALRAELLQFGLNHLYKFV